MNGPENGTNQPPEEPTEEQARLALLVEDDYPKLSLWVEEQLEDLEYRWRHYSTPRSLRIRRGEFRR